MNTVKVSGKIANNWFAEQLVQDLGMDEARNRTCGQMREAIEQAIKDSEKQQKEKHTLRGFGTTYDIESGRSRNWYYADGIKRWADNDSHCNG